MSGHERSEHPNALPNYQIAVITRAKLEKYALDPNHVASVAGKSSGKDKAALFKSILGFEPSNWELLKQDILDQLPFYEACYRGTTIYGREYTVVMSIVGPNGNSADVLTGWIILQDEDAPRLTTTRGLRKEDPAYARYKNCS